ncbi:MAG: hypothetical protein EOQ28_33995, partial [Mesorhizobium sp.]
RRYVREGGTVPFRRPVRRTAFDGLDDRQGRFDEGRQHEATSADLQFDPTDRRLRPFLPPAAITVPPILVCDRDRHKLQCSRLRRRVQLHQPRLPPADRKKTAIEAPAPRDCRDVGVRLRTSATIRVFSTGVQLRLSAGR